MNQDYGDSDMLIGNVIKDITKNLTALIITGKHVCIVYSCPFVSWLHYNVHDSQARDWFDIMNRKFPHFMGY